MCQKAAGNAFAGLAPVRLEDFAWTHGAPAVFRGSSAAERGFCSACGTPLFFRYVDSEWIDITIGSLDQPERVPPELHYDAESRLGWSTRLDLLPSENTSVGGVTGAPKDMVGSITRTTTTRSDHDKACRMYHVFGSGSSEEVAMRDRISLFLAMRRLWSEFVITRRGRPVAKLTHRESGPRVDRRTAIRVGANGGTYAPRLPPRRQWLSP